jgi:hypothetical protein
LIFGAYISAILWRPVLVVEKSGVTGENHRPWASNTNTVWGRARLCKLQKRCTRLAAASDNVYQLLAHGLWFSPGTPDFSTTKTGRHNTAEI